MQVPEIRTIVLVGAGKLATSFGLAARKQGCEILQVYNRTPLAGTQLAEILSSEYIRDTASITKDADLYCIATSDGVVESLSRQFNVGEKLVVHFSGTLDLGVLRHSTVNCGVFYPPQTFARLVTADDFQHLPVCIEASTEDCKKQLVEFASRLSQKVIVVNQQQRMTIHLAAVFASNFTNLMYAISEDLLTSSGLSLDILRPLVEQTARNILQEDVFKQQTGPAIREDEAVLTTHLNMLKTREEYQTIYKILSDTIIQRKKNVKL
jgi:predicted short-subunit dehydrogenase-like oxidoreductase (DUF2520 family)